MTLRDVHEGYVVVVIGSVASSGLLRGLQRDGDLRPLVTDDEGRILNRDDEPFAGSTTRANASAGTIPAVGRCWSLRFPAVRSRGLADQVDQ